jgi:hypothetical protein
MIQPARLLVVSLVLLPLLATCNSYPVHSLLDNFEVRVTSKLSHKEAVKLDFLWVIDHSSSMCQEQRELAKGFDKFVTNLQALGTIDAQMAVVTVQQISDLGGTTVETNQVKQVGQFMHSAATAFPPNCMERVRLPCTTDLQCTKAVVEYQFTSVGPSSMCPVGGTGTYENPVGGNTKWKCDKPGTDPLLTNLNCSINSYCEKRCTSDKECQELYESNVPLSERRAICYIPGGTTPENAGCMFPPDTKTCPTSDKLPPVLKSHPLDAKGKLTNKPTLDLFKCIATVGAGTSTESKFEGGFRSAWYALDPNGINCTKDKTGKIDPAKCQYKQLVRDDAYLVIVFVSDDDDCSVNLDISLSNLNAEEKKVIVGDPKTGKAGILPSEVQDRCQSLGDAVAGNKGLNEGNCEIRKAANPALVCLSDCVKFKVGSDDYAKCIASTDKSILESIKFDTRFATVNDFVNRFRSLKSDPSRVMVAAITGDTLFNSGASALATEFQQRIDVSQYYRSVLKNTAPKQVPYVCQGARGESGYGSRYIALTKAFGENGIFYNICEGEDFGPALTEVANLILGRVIKVCLPHPPNWEDGVPLIKVLRKRGGKTKQMEYVEHAESTKPDSFYLKAAPDCRTSDSGTLPGESQACKSTRDCAAGLVCNEGLCKQYAEAIYFSAVPDPTDEIEVNYAADVGL